MSATKRQGKPVDGLSWTGHKGPWGRNIEWTCDQVPGLTIRHCGHPTALRPYYIPWEPGPKFSRLADAKAAAAELAAERAQEAAGRYDALLAACGLPPVAFVVASEANAGMVGVVAIKRGEGGYFPVASEHSADELNQMAGVSQDQRDAMFNGSLFGWDVPGADPDYVRQSRERAALRAARADKEH